MFNHHFFHGEDVYHKFLKPSGKPTKIALLVDPPFGGRLDALAHTIERVKEDVNKLDGQAEVKGT
jgi:hypothetical protein